ncbi:MAG TPA: SLBB domain-containing protein [Opitutaceae bacterium]
MTALSRIFTILLMMCSLLCAADKDVVTKEQELRSKLISEGKISISGVVRQQGVYPAGDKLSLLEAIAKAGGVDERGWKKAQLKRGDKVHVLNNNKEDGMFSPESWRHRACRT